MFSGQQRNIDFEIKTLLHTGLSHRFLDDGVQPVIVPSSDVKFDFPAPFPTKQRSRHPSAKDVLTSSRLSESSSEDEEEERSITVNGADIGDFPTEYVVEGLRANEMPVIGTYVDPRIVPGFRYRVRRLGTEKFLFQSKAMRLQSIGKGYGKRITFEGESLNQNSNYFYSDTNVTGFGFSLIAAEAGNVFVVNDSDCYPVAESRINKVVSQRELSSDIDDAGNFVKEVSVTFTCTVNYYGENHGLMPLQSQEELQLTGQAFVIRNKNGRQAHTKFIEQIELLQHHGTCTFTA